MVKDKEYIFLKNLFALFQSALFKTVTLFENRSFSMTDNKLIHLLQFRRESLTFVSLKLQENTEKTTGGNYFSLCLHCKKLIFIDQTMTLPRTSLINKVWHNACHYYSCFKINKNSRLTKRMFMGSLGTCIARDCFCGEEIAQKLKTERRP